MEKINSNFKHTAQDYFRKTEQKPFTEPATLLKKPKISPKASFRKFAAEGELSSILLKSRREPLPQAVFEPKFLCDKPKLLSHFLKQGISLDEKEIFDLAIEKGCCPVLQLILERENKELPVWINQGIKKAAEINQQDVFDYLIDYLINVLDLRLPY